MCFFIVRCAKYDIGNYESISFWGFTYFSNIIYYGFKGVVS